MNLRLVIVSCKMPPQIDLDQIHLFSWDLKMKEVSPEILIKIDCSNKMLICNLGNSNSGWVPQQITKNLVATRRFLGRF